MGAQWLSGRVLDLRPKGSGFEPYQHHCVVPLSKNINPSVVLVQLRKALTFITERLLIGRKESNQTKTIMSLQVNYNYRLLESPCRFKTEKDRNAEHCQPMLTLNVTKALLFCFQNNSFTHVQKLF